MLKTLLYNKKINLVCFFGLIASFSLLQAQEQKTVQDIEKIFLHTDRTRYFIGDDLWYKAYDVRATNNLLYDNSNILYVELISNESKIIARNKTNIEMGLGYGDFHLTDSLNVKPGVYQLRAYTNWDRNFGEDFVFTKEIEVLDAFEMHAQANKQNKGTVDNKKSAKATSAITTAQAADNDFTIEFFPEGGSLLENVAGIVGFKAVDSKGKPIEVTGEIFDTNNELITLFQSVHDGMGKVQMIPLEGKSYYAKVKSKNGIELEVALPKAMKNGYVLGYRNFKGRNIVTISTNDATLKQNPNANLRILCQTRGISYLDLTQTITEPSLSFELPKDKVPEGIVQITLFDNNNRAQNERLVYIEREHDLDVQLITDKLTYLPNEKTTVNVSSKSLTGAVKSASYSMSVTDLNGIEDNENGSTICSYFLMESDIRGKVFQPAYYFDANNPKRLEHLDNLLLTQGWRDFVWKSLPAPKSNFKIEKGITISGRVKQVFADKPLENSFVSLSLLNKKRRNFFSLKPDAATGNFKFENLMFSGKTNMFLNSVNGKGKFRGEIVLDTIEQEPIGVNYRAEVANWSLISQLVAETVFRKYAAFGVKPENILNEVSIVSKKKTPLRSMFGIPENSYVADADAKTFTSIYELIAQKLPGVMLDGDSIRFLRSNSTPFYVLNGFEVTKEQIDVIQPQDVEKIDIIRGLQATMFFGEAAENGFIAIYTDPNAPKRVKEKTYAIQKEIDGYYISRNFYSPTPEQVQLDLDNKLAVRNTIYWNPYVHPDKTGNTTVAFYNTKVETKVKVALEGMTAAGIPVAKTCYYTIKK